MSVSSHSRRTVLSLTLAAACWGIGTVVSKRATDEIPPLTLLAVQLVASLVVLLALMRWNGMPLSDPSASPVLARLGLLNPGLAYALGLLGLVYISASLSVMLWAMEPLLILFLAGWLLRERVGASLIVLSLWALVGVLLVIYEPDSTGTALGVTLTFAGVACCAIYTVGARRWLGTAESTSQVVLAQQAYALVLACFLVGAAWLVTGAVVPGSVSAEGWAAAVASGILYYAAAYWFYLSALRHVDASVAAVSFYLIPVFGVAAAVLLIGERLSASQWLGVAIVLVSTYLVFRGTTGAAVVSPSRSDLDASSR
jgi:probable blue pigment (indigoidine) exporter